MRIYYVISGALGSLANSPVSKREGVRQSGTPLVQSDAMELAFSLADWSEGEYRW